MIISVAISFRNGALWGCAEDFESAEEGFLYACNRGVEVFGDIQNIVVAPLRATGLEMSAAINAKLQRVRDGQALRRFQEQQREARTCC